MPKFYEARWMVKMTADGFHGTWCVIEVVDGVSEIYEECESAEIARTFAGVLNEAEELESVLNPYTEFDV